nr:hypothetical protein Itr_chr03CG03980 [Ipomoea trifida]
MMQPYEEEITEDTKNKILAIMEEFKQDMANMREEWRQEHMPSENNCIIEDVDNEVNFLNPYDFNDSDSFDSSDDDGNCVDTCENNSFNSNDNDGLESFTFDDNSLINEHVGELHDMLCNVDDDLNVDASLHELNDVEIVTFLDNCLDDALYIHELIGEDKEETGGDLRDVLSSKEEEGVENENVKEEVKDKNKTSDESVREEVEEKVRNDEKEFGEKKENEKKKESWKRIAYSWT